VIGRCHYLTSRNELRATIWRIAGPLNTTRASSASAITTTRFQCAVISPSALRIKPIKRRASSPVLSSSIARSKSSQPASEARKVRKADSVLAARIHKGEITTRAALHDPGYNSRHEIADRSYVMHLDMRGRLGC